MSDTEQTPKAEHTEQQATVEQSNAVIAEMINIYANEAAQRFAQEAMRRANARQEATDGAE